MGIQPGAGAVHGPVAATLEQGRMAVRAAPAVGLVVVNVKPAIESPHRIQYKRADKCGSCVSALPHYLGKGRRCSVQARRSQVAHAVEHRIGSRHDDSVGRKREWHLSISVLEANSLAGQLIHRRGLDAAIPVATELIGAHGVSGNQLYRMRRPGGGDLVSLQRGAQVLANSPEKEKTHDLAVTPAHAHKSILK